MVKSEFPLRRDLMQLPSSLSEPRIRDAGLAWLAMALDLANQEVFSDLNLRWRRDLMTGENLLVLEFDSSKNYQTKKLMALPDAPPQIYRRRERFDAALAKLFTQTTAEDLWAALAGHRLAQICAWDLTEAWCRKIGERSTLKSYPRFTDARDFLNNLMEVFDEEIHPWL